MEGSNNDSNSYQMKDYSKEMSPDEILKIKENFLLVDNNKTKIGESYDIKNDLNFPKIEEKEKCINFEGTISIHSSILEYKDVSLKNEEKNEMLENKVSNQENNGVKKDIFFYTDDSIAAHEINNYAGNLKDYKSITSSEKSKIINYTNKMDPNDNKSKRLYEKAKYYHKYGKRKLAHMFYLKAYKHSIQDQEILYKLGDLWEEMSKYHQSEIFIKWLSN